MSAQRRVGVGIIGTGNISAAYLKAMPGFDTLEVIGIADMKPEVAEARGDTEAGLEEWIAPHLGG